MSPLQYVFGRMLIAALVLSVTIWIGKRAWPHKVSAWAHVSVLGICGVFIPSLLFGFAGERIPSALSAIYNSSVPILTVLITLLALRQERVNLRKILGINLGALGILVVFSPWSLNQSDIDLIGQLCALGAVTSVGFTFADTRKYLTPLRLDPVGIAAGQSVVAAVVSTPLVLFTDVNDVLLTPGIVASMIMLGAVSSGISFVWNFQVIEQWGASSASMVTYLATITGVVCGIIFMQEILTLQQLIGAVLVLAAVAIGISAGKTRPSTHEQP